MNVIKRNDQVVEFDITKIAAAIRGANGDVNEQHRMPEEMIEGIASVVAAEVKKKAVNGAVHVEAIQDMVERELMARGNYPVAKAFILYRNNRTMIRNANTTDEAILALIRGSNEDMARENSNKDTTVASTQRDYIAGIVSRDLTRRILLPPEISKAHDEGLLHFHDADYFAQPIHNCCLINIADMLDNGTMMNGKLIESPKSFQVACTVTTQIIACVASNQYGGQSVDVSHLGKYLRRSRDKFRRKILKAGGDDMTPELLDRLVEERLQTELSNGVQTIQYQINTLMTTNGQSPFVTLFLYVRDDDPYVEENAMIVEEILRQRIIGIKNESGVYVTPAFPKLVYVLDENNNLTGGRFDYLTRLACECSAKRMYPDYVSAKKMRENYEGNVYSCMGCRSWLIPWQDENGNYKFEGRFNQGVVTLNLPQIGLEIQGDMDKFWPEFDRRLKLCREALMVRHKALLGTKSDVSPIHWQYGAIARKKSGETIDDLLYGNYSTLSLGYIGLYELTYLMTGQSHTTPEGKEFAIKVMKHMKETVTRWREESNIGFTLYGTPAESLCYRLAEVDRKKYGDVENVTDKGYYTNSYHVDVREKIDAFTKLSLEAEFQPLSGGGCISYVEVPNMKKNLTALADLIKFIYDNVQYAEFNTKSDYCQECGYDGEIKIVEDADSGELVWECPCCGNRNQRTMNVVRRTCGYLGENYWNVGKTREINSRVLHL